MRPVVWLDATWPLLTKESVATSPSSKMPIAGPARLADPIVPLLTSRLIEPSTPPAMLPTLVSPPSVSPTTCCRSYEEVVRTPMVSAA